MSTSKTPVVAESAEEMLARVLGGIPGVVQTPITGDEVEFHDGKKIILPNDMTYGKAFDILKRLEEEAETETSFDRFFNYRPDDGAYAAAQCIKHHWGMSLGKATFSFFGKNPPEMRTIAIGVNETMQVPWGHMQIPTMPGLNIYIGATNSKDYGQIFGINCTGPKKYRDEVEQFFDEVADYLRENSIYRGRAIVGSNDPQFLDMSGFRPEQVVFSDAVTEQLNGTIWAPIKYTDAMRREGVPLKRAVLLHGQFGTGKTSVGQLTAGVAVSSGWTFISARPGRDKIEDVLRTARLYQPAVVFVEDIDNESSTSESDEVTRLLEAFDGITAKGGELMVVMTTNHLERIHKGMLRPGRLDAVIEVGTLDRNGVERLIKVIVEKGKLADDVDYDLVFEAMEGFLPAFVRESITRAVTFAINRLEGGRGYLISTPDLVSAAHSLHDQLAALNDANEGEKKPVLDVVLSQIVRESAKGLAMYDYNHEDHYRLTEAPTDDE